MRIAPGLLALVALLALTACADGDDPEITGPVPPVPPKTKPARFHVAAWLEQGVDDTASTLTWRLTAVLDAGLRDSLPRPANDTLWIDDQPLLPEHTEIPVRLYSFEGEIEASLAHQEIVRVRPPTVDGVSKDEISLRFVGRTGGDTLSRTAEGDVLLPILVPDAPSGPPPPHTHWHAATNDSATWVAHLHGSHMPGGPLRIPALYLPPPEAQGRVHFEIRSGNAEQPVTLHDYVTSYYVVSGFEWSIAPVPP